ncbi:MAG: GTP pyrophosphokinase [Lachnospiraceae bacterium]|nr:GTP pyrophosphokinase [Lachnospiraceae bacterium]
MIQEIIEEDTYRPYALEAMEYIQNCFWEMGMVLAVEKERKVINQISCRIKSADSILKKIKKKNYPLDREGIFKCNDLLGIRMVCLFMDDVYEIAKRARNREDFRIIKEKDYIKKPKSNGYMSLHLIVEVPISLKGKEDVQPIKVEVQLRTVAMDFWSVLDHQLVYKKEFPGAETVGKELKEYAATISELDKNMLKLRKKIERLSGQLLVSP